MTQPAKVQEPSMEEILASIRRIIADDEAKPAEKAGAPVAAVDSPPAAKPSFMKEGSDANAPPPAKTATQPAAKETNSHDDIDAMLAGLDAAPSDAEVRQPLPDGDVFELTDEMALPDP